MSLPLDGIISCKGFAYNICNKNITGDNPLLKLGTITGVTGSHIKIECLLGNSNAQGSTSQGNILPLPTEPNANAPFLLTIYGSFHNNLTTGDDQYCNFEGFYTVVGNPTCILGVFVEYNTQYNYNVYIEFNSLNTNLNYFVYLPNNCTWENNGNAYNSFQYADPSHWYQFPKL
jgi:hypothetical protein